MTGYDLGDADDREDRRKHLELVSATVGRMASTSAMFKGWSITLASAAFGLAAVRDNWLLLFLGLAGIVVFAALDSFYLSLEKKFRDLYSSIVDNSAVPLAMNVSSLPANPTNRSYRSTSIWGFHVPLAVAGMILFGAALAADESEDRNQGHPHGNHDCHGGDFPKPAIKTPGAGGSPSSSDGPSSR